MHHLVLFFSFLDFVALKIMFFVLGVYIVTCKGEVLQHLPTRDSSASSLAIDPTNWHLLVSVMHSKGRSIHAFDITNRFKKVEVNFFISSFTSKCF